MKLGLLNLITLSLILMPQVSHAGMRSDGTFWPDKISDCNDYKPMHCDFLYCLCLVGTNNPPGSVIPIDEAAATSCGTQHVQCQSSGEGAGAPRPMDENLQQQLNTENPY